MITTDTHVYFYSSKTIYSNWHRCKFTDTVTGIQFSNSEQAFMYWKADFFRDFKSRELIVSQPDTKLVKELGRGVEGYNDGAWDSVRLGFMNWVNLCKFSQNNHMRDELLSTGDRILVEASPYDKIWGVGLTETDPLIRDEETWKGNNLLGISLMFVRDRIK